MSISSFYRKEDISLFYRMEKTLGSGSFAVVKKAVNKETGKVVAIKCISKTSLTAEDRDALKVEVAILQKVVHPNIVKLYELFDTPKTFYMVMELMTGGELFDRIIDKEKYSESEARSVIQSLCSALQYCHNMGIVHRDLKPENLLYENAKPDAAIKIADFGLAKLLSEDSLLMHTACGTPGYVAPEILKGLAYEKSVDLWSIGVVLYILLCGFPPFYHDNNVQLYELIKSGKFDYPSPYWDTVSNDAKDLISHLLIVDPKKRLSIDQTLNHIWVLGTSNTQLGSVQEQMKKYLLKKKFKKAVLNVQIANTFKSAGMSKKLKKAVTNKDVLEAASVVEAAPSEPSNSPGPDTR